MAKKIKPFEYEGEFETTVNVYIKYDDGYLMAWTDDCMEDGIDYFPYEDRLEKGEDYTQVCEDIITEISRG